MKIRLQRVPDIFNGTKLSELGSLLRSICKDIEMAFARIRTINDRIIIGGGTPILKHLSTTATWNPGNLVSGAQTSTTVALPAAALGDVVTCGFSLDLQGLRLTGYVSSASTITCLLRNGTAGAVDLASGALRVSVWQY